MDGVPKHHPSGEAPSRATENYPQFRRAVQVFRLQEGTMGGLRDQDRDRNPDRAPSERPWDLLRLWEGSARLRSFADPAVRVCPAMADCGVLHVCHATRRLPDVWRESGASSLVRWQEPVDHDVPLVLGGLGQAAFLERGCRRVLHDMAERVSLGKTRGFVGVGTPQPERHRGDRRGRSAVAVRPQVFDAGLPDRRRLEAAVMDWQEPYDQNLSAILPNARQGTFRQTKVRVQRHVEAVLESDCQKSQRCDPRAGPVSSYAEDEQGDRRGPGWRGEATEGRWLRAGTQALAMVPVEAAGKPDRQTDGETFRVASIQPAVGAGSLVARRFPTVLGVREPCMGREVPRPVVSTNDAEQARTDEESGSYLTQPPGVDSQLVPSEGRPFQRNRRRIQQQSQTDHEKIVRLSYL